MASGDTLAKFFPHDNEPPTASPATPDVRNSHPVLDFATGESAVFSDILSRAYGGGGITVYVHYSMTSAITNNVEWETAFERIGDQQQDIDADSFAAAVESGDVAVPGTSGLVDVVAIAHTDGAQIDSIAVGESYRLKVTRRTPTGTDATGDAELVGIELKET